MNKRMVTSVLVVFMVLWGVVWAQEGQPASPPKPAGKIKVGVAGDSLWTHADPAWPMVLAGRRDLRRSRNHVRSLASIR